jgi:hypothetical protein
MGCSQDSFRKSVGEVETYRAGGKLPDIFYIVPEVEAVAPKAKKSRKKKGGKGGTGEGVCKSMQ